MTRPDKRRQIMQAAEKLFTTRRFHEITTDDVAREAGVGKGTMYRYFADKDDLFFQTATAGLDELCEVVRRCVVGGRSFRGQLRGACEQIAGFFDRRKQLFRMMSAEDSRITLTRGSFVERWVAHRKKLVAAVGDIVRRGVEEGVIRDDLPADVLADFLLGMLRTRARDLEDAPAAVRRIEVIVDLFCHGAGRAPARAPRHAGARQTAASRRAVSRRIA
jgi:AcrR family transcriptional regulator